MHRNQTIRGFVVRAAELVIEVVKFSALPGDVSTVRLMIQRAWNFLVRRSKALVVVRADCHFRMNDLR